jgi:hypothetical protein
MRLDEAIREASATPAGHERGKKTLSIVEFMRNKMGLTYARCAEMAKKSGVDSSRWEEMLAEADDYANET